MNQPPALGTPRRAMNSQLRHIVIFGLGPLNQRDAASNGMSD